MPQRLGDVGGKRAAGSSAPLGDLRQEVGQGRGAPGPGRTVDVVGGAELVDGGRPDDTPVAVIMEGTMPEERTVFSTLGELADDLVAEHVKPPAIIVVGDVVAVANPQRYPRG